MAQHIISKSALNFDYSRLPSEMADLVAANNGRCDDKATFSPYHDDGVNYTTLTVFVANAIYEYVAGCVGNKTKLALVKSGANWYACEHQQEDKTILFQITGTGKASGALIDSTGRYNTIPPFGTRTGKGADIDMTSAFACALMLLCDKDETVSKRLEGVVERYSNDSKFEANDIFYLCDAVEGAVARDVVPMKLTGGNVEFITETKVTQGNLNGITIIGTPKYINEQKGADSSEALTFAQAKKKFATFASKRKWTPEEEALIPSFPDDYPVMAETVKLCSRYISTHGNRRPMVNFMWRGITSYGKSTGVEMMAALLHMPLLRMTCNSSMETQDFLSNIVPAGKNEDEAPAVECSTAELPSFADIACDPESSYEELTGKRKPGVTADECLSAYAERVAKEEQKKIFQSYGDTSSYENTVSEIIANNSGDPDALKKALVELETKREIHFAVEMAKSKGAETKSLFKQVESNFVKALAKGYIVEVQEISRIKDSGVLVGLNEYDRPNAVIPLVDGSSVKRHPDAIVIYTDNVGYSSCRPIDPSVLRRMSIILDSNEIPKEQAIARVVYNTGFSNESLLDTMYTVWVNIQKTCLDSDITEGSVSLTELEMWAQCVMADGYTNAKESCKECVISKATSVKAEQDSLMSLVDLSLK